MNEYWNGSPPVHVMIASYFGIKASKAEIPATQSATEQQAQELMGTFPVGVMPKILTREEYESSKSN